MPPIAVAAAEEAITLLKNEQDVHLFERLVFMSRRKT